MCRSSAASSVAKPPAAIEADDDSAARKRSRSSPSGSSSNSSDSSSSTESSSSSSKKHKKKGSKKDKKKRSKKDKKKGKKGSKKDKKKSKKEKKEKKDTADRKATCLDFCSVQAAQPHHLSIQSLFERPCRHYKPPSRTEMQRHWPSSQETAAEKKAREKDEKKAEDKRVKMRELDQRFAVSALLKLDQAIVAVETVVANEHFAQAPPLVSTPMYESLDEMKSWREACKMLQAGEDITLPMDPKTLMATINKSKKDDSWLRVLLWRVAVVCQSWRGVLHTLSM